MAVLRSEQGAQQTGLRVINDFSEALQVHWVDYGGKEVLYATVEPWGGTWVTATYVSHPWRLRLAATGSLLTEHTAAAAPATLRVQPDGSCAAVPGLKPPGGRAEPPHPVWGEYRQRGAALGVIPIMAYDCVGDAAVRICQATVGRMLEGLDAAFVQSFVGLGGEVAIIARCQNTTDLPAYRHLRGQACSNGGGDFDAATRGLGGNVGCPTTSVGEENLTMEGDDRYYCESILVHELAHAVMDLGLHGHPLRDAIVAAYQHAKARGLHDPGAYCMSNECEYWAEGSQAWFDATTRTDVTSGITSRQQLRERDPELASILVAVYGDGPWRYPQTAPAALRPFRAHKAPADAAGGGDGPLLDPSDSGGFGSSLLCWPAGGSWSGGLLGSCTPALPPGSTLASLFEPGSRLLALAGVFSCCLGPRPKKLRDG